MMPRHYLTLLTIAWIAACGNGDGEPEAPDPSPGPAATTTPADTAPVPIEPGSQIAQLPPEFPSGFPLPPDHVVVEGSATRDEAGVFSNVRLAVESADPAVPFAWYRLALGDAGWRIASQGRSDSSHTLHATLGESYVDLTVRLDEERAGWVVIEASIWQVEAL
jgi:hypothetical protein